MDIGNILNTKGNAAAAAAAAEAQLRQQLEDAAQMTARTNSDLGSDRSSSSNHQQPLHQMTNIPSNMAYPSPSQQQGLQMVSNSFMPGTLHDDGYHPNADGSASRPNSDGAPKQFACSSCGKGFARRSDLARHGK